MAVFIPNQAKAGQGCTTRECHEGISAIVPQRLPMMQMIQQNGQRHGDFDGCIICHGGNPNTQKKEKAHKGIPRTLKKALGPKDFYPDPGALHIAKNTCGACHAGYVRRMQLSLMNTEAGKISGNMNTWGIDQVADYKVPWGNYTINDEDGFRPHGATPDYQQAMADLKEKYPEKYPQSLTMLPLPDEASIEKDPKLAAFIYQRKECQRCHLGVKGRQVRGDYRGMGCSACHMLYSNEGFYEGNDQSIPKDEPGHILKHRIAGNRKTGGIPVETCNSCHNRGKRIGVSFQGMMETPFSSPFDENGNNQPRLHGKYYRFISDDLHHQTKTSRKENPKAGLLCQDCHTSFDIHGNGNISGTTLASVEIECTDCHGTPDFYPWELPLGFGDEFDRDLAGAESRGLATHRLMTDRQFGSETDGKDGYLLSARGNPLGNVVKENNTVILHSSAGNDFLVPQLKTIHETGTWKDPAGSVAMAAVKPHLNKMECYTCHASWVAQCYGCHVKIDFSKQKKDFTRSNIDWVASGNARQSNGQTVESDPKQNPIQLNGQITESQSYTRWEQPILGINGEGRVSPLMPGCQVVYTIVDAKGQVIAHNQIAKNSTEAKSINQDAIPLAIDMAPVQPHTAQRNARTCEDCHTSVKTAGLGIGQERFGGENDTPVVQDLKDAATGKIIPEKARTQISAIKNLTFDWSRIIDENGTQIATVGTHWPLSRAFNETELDGFLRVGTCLGCHQKMDDKGFWKTISTDGRLSRKAHQELMKKMAEKLGQ